MQLKKLLVLVALISTVTTQASHILGGIIQVAQTSPDSTSIGLYIASESFPPMPASVSVQKWVMNSQGWYDLDGYVTLDKFNTNTHQGYNTANYGSDYLDLDSGKYRFIYTNCCWGPLNNSSNTSNSEVVISTDYWHVPNNTTPFMEQPLWINVEKNAVNSMKPVWGVFNCHFTNPDGDSVNLYKTEIYSSYSNGVFVPQVQSSTNVLANNDSITFVGTNLGPVGYGFQIDKYRSGYLLTTQRIQWTFIVVNSTLSIPDHKIDKKVIGVWDWQGRYIQEDIEMLPANRLYLIRYSDGTTEKILIIK
jgi:hypothetical protein